MDKFAQKRYLILMGVGIIAILLMICIGLTYGEMRLSLIDVISTLLHRSNDPSYTVVIFQFRLPRIVLGLLIGISLGIAGTVVQSLTRNPLADPGILGINAGAGMFIVLFMFLLRDQIDLTGNLAIMLMPLFGIAGGLLSALLIFLLAKDQNGLNPQRLILVGIAITTGFSAITLYASLKMDPQDFEKAASWLSGSLNSANWLFVISLLPWMMILLPWLLYQTRLLDVMRLGDHTLLSLGIPLRQKRTILMFISVGLVASGVAVSGSIGFVGLIAPHMATQLVGLAHRRALPLSGVIGALLVLIADFIGRTLFSPAQLPVGIVLSIIGAPYFVWLLSRRRKV